MASRGSVFMLVLLLGVVCTAPAVVVRGGGQEWVVGDSMGWSFGVAGWAKGKAIQAGDVLVFKYDQTAHDVVEVDEAAYNACEMPIGGGTPRNSGNDRVVVRAGKSFFVCSQPGRCANGMKIAITTKEGNRS
ncbi:hypothetical protein C2845_PM11G18780 [Panicum miliaceum]|uniref:Plantacyanin n=1 Tax=Panicum miliaceum TaxID=4540 RepID=A0A3L6RTC9_PANMI|nr:hypothetical protein C2845_PM11G18780 [Panicum miliaceum]